jgi:hypothetical protein
VKIISVLFFFLLSAKLYSYESKVEVFKKGDFKTFKAITSGEFEGSLEKVIEGIENFDEKCNNEKRSKRKFIKWETKCRFHNENLVEAVKIFKPMDQKLKKYNGFQYLVWRNIYNSGKYSHYDVVTKKRTKEEVIITHEMLSDSEVKNIIEKPEKINSAFDNIRGTYKVSKKPNGKIKVEYIYESKTDHWFLTKDFLEEKIINNITSGTLQALKTIELSLKEVRK